jgi:hypothetical protein
MKSLSLLLLAFTLTATSLHAQTSPPAEIKDAAAPSTNLSQEERDRAIAYLKETEKDFLASIKDVSDAQWKFKAAPERWSIAETAEHIALAEDLIWQNVSENVMKSPPAPEKRAEVQGKDELILTKVPDRSRKAQAPEVLKPTGKWATRAELARHFQEARAREIAYLSETKEDLRNHFGEHPAFKTLDGYQWLIFNGAHCKRHTAQIEEVKTDPNYPKS